MSIEQILQDRASHQCELCKSDQNLSMFEVAPIESGNVDKAILICKTCKGQLDTPATTDANHWRCLNDSMWSTVPAVQVVAWRQLKYLSTESWAQDLLDMLYLDEEIAVWAQSGLKEGNTENDVICRDSNGTQLQAGDSVTLIKDLVVKGAGFTAKRGTMVKNISLTDNSEQIEGKINGVQLVLLSCYMKKSI
jgi:protein PhnA